MNVNLQSQSQERSCFDPFQSLIHKLVESLNLFFFGMEYEKNFVVYFEYVELQHIKITTSNKSKTKRSQKEIRKNQKQKVFEARPQAELRLILLLELLLQPQGQEELLWICFHTQLLLR
jgi:hypothetical protein